TATRAEAPSRGRRSSCRPTAYGTCTSSDRRRWRATPLSPARRRIRRCGCRPAGHPQCPVAGGDGIERSMLFPTPRASCPDLLGEAVHDLDAGQVTLVHGAVERLSRERLLMDRSIGIAIEEASELVLELAYPRDRAGDERPCELLVRQPFAAFDRIHEMAL